MKELIYGKPFYVYADEAILKDITVNVQQGGLGRNRIALNGSRVTETLLKDGVRYPVYLKGDANVVLFFVSYKNQYADSAYYESQFFSDKAQNKNIVLRKAGDTVELNCLVSTKEGGIDYIGNLPKQIDELVTLQPIEVYMEKMKAENELSISNDELRKLFIDFYPIKN